MKKLSKKRIDEVAAKMREVFRKGAGLVCEKWRTTDARNRANWRNLAKFVLTDLQPVEDYKMPPFMGEATHQGDLARRQAHWPKSTLRPVRGTPTVKSCKVVRGKTVCE
jgi:hypothetical protein